VSDLAGAQTRWCGCSLSGPSERSVCVIGCYWVVGVVRGLCDLGVERWLDVRGSGVNA
jgi:hypothetical protein